MVHCFIGYKTIKIGMKMRIAEGFIPEILMTAFWFLPDELPKQYLSVELIEFISDDVKQRSCQLILIIFK